MAIHNNNNTWFEFIRLNLSVLAAFYFSQILADYISVPPYELTLLRPSGGIALLSFYIWGNKVLPAIIFGVLTLALQRLPQIMVNQSELYTVLAAIYYSSTTLVKVAVGQWLLKRYIGLCNPLTDTKTLLWFFLIAGPISSLPSSIIGGSGAIFIGYLSPNEVIYSSLVWLTASSLGVFIVLPVIMVFFAKPLIIWRKRISSIAIPMIVLDIILLICVIAASNIERERIHSEFKRETRLVHNNIEQEFSKYQQIAVLLGETLTASQLLDEKSFTLLAKDVVSRYAEFEGMGWLPKLPHSQRKAFEKTILQGDLSTLSDDQGNRRVAADRQFYFPLIHVYSKIPADFLVGINITNSPHVFDKFYQSAESKTTTIFDTGLGQLYSGAGSLIIIPVYEQAAEYSFDNLKGVVVVSLSPTELITRKLNTNEELLLHYKLKNDGTVIFDSNPSPAISRTTVAAPFSASYPISGLESSLEIEYLPNEQFAKQYHSWKLWWLVILAIAFSSFICFTLFVISSQVFNRDLLVRKRTRQLQIELDWRKSNNEEQQRKNSALQIIATSSNLDEVLKQLSLLIKQRFPESTTTTLLLSDDGKHLITAMSEDFSDEYNTAVETLEVQMGAGSCLEASVSGKPVIVDDIANHPNWKDFQELANSENIKACWSFPILSSEDQVLGTFAIYHNLPTTIGKNDQEWVSEVVNIASIAIEKNRTEEHLEHLVYYDALTKLPNRNALIEQIQTQVLSATNNQLYGAVLFIDLDNFKTLNDSLGHDYGDQLLQMLATKMTSMITDGNNVARWGGDEFVIISKPQWEFYDEAVNYATELATSVSKTLTQPFDLNGYEHRVTCSIGISLYHGGNTNLTDILRQADIAMYNAKAKGRNTYSFYEAEMQAVADAKLTMEKDIRDALANNQFSLAYQPIFNGRDKVYGAEALIRWDHPEKGNIAPIEFISLAESTGLIKEVSEWVIQQVIEQSIQCPQLNYISLNVSPVHFHQQDFVSFIADTLLANDVVGERLVIEITEGTMLDNMNVAIQKIAELKKLGIRISLDDFGTGYSSLSYLAQLSIDQIKIDKSFTQKILSEDDHSPIIETIIALSKHLNTQLVIEGIETDSQLNYLLNNDCHFFQGYMLGKPVDRATFVDTYIAP